MQRNVAAEITKVQDYEGTWPLGRALRAEEEPDAVLR